MGIKEDIRAFYESGRCRIELPEKPSQHFFLVRDLEGRFGRVPIKAHTEAQLMQQVSKLGGIDIYYSTSRWLKPTKARYEIGNPLDRILVNNRLAFDIDPPENSVYGIGIAQKTAQEISKYMLAFPEYELDYVAFSGRGFQIVYRDLIPSLPVDYTHRISYIRNKRKAFIVGNQIESKVHSVVTTNPMAVIRCVGSANSRTGFICSKLTEKSLFLPTRELLNHIQFVTAERPVIPDRYAQGNDVSARNMMSPPCKNTAELSDQAIAPQPIPATYVSNKVLGTKDRLALFLSYDLQLHDVVNDIKRLSDTYKLPTSYVLELDNRRYVVCLKTFQRRRLQRIVNASKSVNKHELMKFGQCFVPASINGSVIGFTTSIITNDYCKAFISKTHKAWLNSLGIDTGEYPNQHGDKGIRVYHGVLR